MKKVIKTVALSASLLALASTGFAADLNMNIFGASAQGKFWNTYGKFFVEAAIVDGGLGCDKTAGSTIVGYADPSTKKLGITVGRNCAVNDGGNVYIRYTADKSVEGPRSVMNIAPTIPTAGCNDTTATAGRRVQAHWTGGTTIVPLCQDVNVGASDVASEAFTQESHGNKNGNYNASPYNEVLEGQVIPGSNEIDNYRQPVIVPFSFFANATNLPELNNLTRQQALLLMSGNVANWNQFGPDFPTSKKVVLCMRHAGSGTHATLDKAIMRGDRALPTNNQLNVLASNPQPGIMFHESSSDMLKCVQENGLYTFPAGAIGYADSDGIVNTYNGDGTENLKTEFNQIKRVKYNGAGEGMTAANKTKYGFSALKNEIKNGSYEFWASQWMYLDSTQEAPETLDLYTKMMDYASTTALPCPGLGCYWLTAGELNVSKEDDSAVPHF